MTPLGISVGEKGTSQQGYAFLFGHPRAFGEGEKNLPPDQPTISVQSTGPTSVVLTSSAYSDPNGHPHGSSRWQVALAADTSFSSPVFDSGDDAVNLTSITVTGLDPETDYIARVLHTEAIPA